MFMECSILGEILGEISAYAKNLWGVLRWFRFLPLASCGSSRAVKTAMNQSEATNLCEKAFNPHLAAYMPQGFIPALTTCASERINPGGICSLHDFLPGGNRSCHKKIM